MVIGVSDCSKFIFYEKWIIDSSDDIEIVKLSSEKNNLHDLQRCDGLVLTGGEDVHPEYYGKPEYMKYLNPDFINYKRDLFELNLLNSWFIQNKPLLGICRGLQICNVYFGGTLIYDIPSTGKREHAGKTGYDLKHEVIVEENTLLYSIVNTKTGIINSSHHQAVDRTGKGLIVNAISDDYVIEGLEYENNIGKPFMILVQWHPERMEGKGNNFSEGILKRFLLECKK